jgi:hypothetical protein
MSQPRNADSLAQAQAFDTGSHGVDAPDDLVPGNDGHLGMRQLAVDDVQVGSADTTCGDGDSDLSGAGLPVRQLLPFERRADLVQYHRVHETSSGSRTIVEVRSADEEA